MRKTAAVLLSFFLWTVPAFADTPKDGDAQPAENAKTTKKPVKSATAVLAEQVEALRQTLEAQQAQIKALQDELAKRDSQIGDAKSAAAAADAKASDAEAKVSAVAASAAEVKSTTNTLSSDVADLKLGSDSLKGAVQDTQKKIIAAESPSTIHYKGVTITPGGFLAAETVFRNRAASSDINTPFTGIPFSAADLAHVTENNFSARQSRLSLLVEGKLANAKIGGYYEADFLSAGTTSNNRQSNSYTWRTRQAFAQIAWDNGVSLTGGQMWTLATENRKGIANRTESNPLQIDPQYVVGYTWARQYGFRVVKNFHDKFALAFAVEAPQATIGGRGFSTVTTINNGAAPSTIVTSGATTATTGNFFLNAPGSGGGLYNAFDTNGYTTNKAPDLIFKAAADPGFGHYELLGIVSFFRDRVYPCGVVGTNANDTVTPATPTVYTGNCTSANPTVVSSFGAHNTSTTGGGIGASGLWTLFNKKADFGVKILAGDGIGRYGSSQLADATARPDGTLALIRNAQGLARLELHPTPKLDLYAYWGAEYAWRAGYQGYTTISVLRTAAIPATPPTASNPAGTPPIPATLTTTITQNAIGGYGNTRANNSGCATEGVPVNQFNPSSGSNCAGDIRLIQEPTIGFWYKFYQGTKGRVQFGMQYSYLTKSAWSGTGGVAAGAPAIAPKGIDNMIFTSLRYYIP
ncbi:MAG TPA: hypothetical protein VMT51_09500 [Dongiaceae bacterium]|nr:hypothetical protein [Dongiaceae bacterium]